LVMFNIYIQRATEFFGVTRTRTIFEKAIEVLPDRDVKDMCLRYAELERKLGEIDRARAIYMHCAQFCDPRTNPTFWETWREFEVQHGNKDTFAEFLRIRRSVQAQYNTSLNFNMNAEIIKQVQQEEESKQKDEMKKLEEQAKDEESGVSTGFKLEEMSIGARFAPETTVVVRNVEEINLEEEAQEGEDVDKDFDVEKLQVPAAVFGSAITEVEEQLRQQEQKEKQERKPTATERLRKRKRQSM